MRDDACKGHYVSCCCLAIVSNTSPCCSSSRPFGTMILRPLRTNMTSIPSGKRRSESRFLFASSSPVAVISDSCDPSSSGSSMPKSLPVFGSSVASPSQRTCHQHHKESDGQGYEPHVQHLVGIDQQAEREEHHDL